MLRINLFGRAPRRFVDIQRPVGRQSGGARIQERR
jgi:hypothetical protein